MQPQVASSATKPAGNAVVTSASPSPYSIDRRLPQRGPKSMNVLYQPAVHHLDALAAARPDGRHRLPWARRRIDIRNARRRVGLLFGITVDHEAMIASPDST